MLIARQAVSVVILLGGFWLSTTGEHSKGERLIYALIWLGFWMSFAPWRWQ